MASEDEDEGIVSEVTDAQRGRNEEEGEKGVRESIEGW